MNPTERVAWVNQRLGEHFQHSPAIMAMNLGHYNELFGKVPVNQSFQAHEATFQHHTSDAELLAVASLMLVKFDVQALLGGETALLFSQPEFVSIFFETLLNELRTVAYLTGQRHDRLIELLTSFFESAELQRVETDMHEKVLKSLSRLRNQFEQLGSEN